MSADEPKSRSGRRQEKEYHSQRKKEHSTHSQTSMSVDESSSENTISRSKKQKHDRRKTKECRAKRKHGSNRECSCLRKRTGQGKTDTRPKTMNRTSITECYRCNCSDTSLSSLKSTKKHFIREQYFDSKTSNKDKYSNSISSGLDCNFCEGCLEQKINVNQKNKPYVEVTCKCYSSSEVTSFVSQTDTSHGMSVAQEIKRHRNKHLKSNVEKNKQENTAARDGDQEIERQGNDVKKKNLADNTSVTCVCIYPGSDESPDKKTPHENNITLQGKNTSNHRSPLNLLKISSLRHEPSNTEPKYKADADFCECFSNLVQPPTKDKTFKEIEAELKRSGMAKPNRKDNVTPVASCMCSDKLVENSLSGKNKKPMDTEHRENMDCRPEVDYHSNRAEISREMGKQQCGSFKELCCRETPTRTPSEIVYSAYFSQTSIVDTNSFPPYERTRHLRNRASCTEDTTKHAPSIPKSNSF